MGRVLILGAKGMVGSALEGVLSSRFDVVAWGRETLDITDETQTLAGLQEVRPATVVHAAAYTDVDGCERDPDQAFSVNSQGTLHVARACREVGARLVYLSTDYVFDGKSSRPYREEDPVNPLSVYGRSKLEGERHVEDLLEEFVIVRTQWLFAKSGKNFVTAILNRARRGEPLRVVQDQVGSPTYVVDLSWAIFRLLERGCRGVFHVANSSSCSWYDFAREILKTVEISDIEIVPVEGASVGRPAPRPRYSVLDCGKLTRETGTTMRPWWKALRECIERRSLP